MSTRRIVWAVALSMSAANAHAQHGQHAQSYSGQEQRAIKALSEDEVKQYLAGAGMGFARAAELNRYPGPMHVLELADKLRLTEEQRVQTEKLMHAHKAHARELGRKVVDSERRLEELFRSGSMDAEELARRVNAVAAAQGEYRLSHLETHRRMRPLLSPEQIALYDQLRGYGAASAHSPHQRH